MPSKPLILSELRETVVVSDFVRGEPAVLVLFKNGGKLVTVEEIGFAEHRVVLQATAKDDMESQLSGHRHGRIVDGDFNVTEIDG